MMYTYNYLKERFNCASETYSRIPYLTLPHHLSSFELYCAWKESRYDWYMHNISDFKVQNKD